MHVQCCQQSAAAATAAQLAGAQLYRTYFAVLLLTGSMQCLNGAAVVDCPGVDGFLGGVCCMHCGGQKCATAIQGRLQLYQDVVEGTSCMSACI